MKMLFLLPALPALASLLVVTACGGGGSGGGDAVAPIAPVAATPPSTTTPTTPTPATPAPTPSPPAAPAEPSLAQRSSAATATAQSGSNDCAAIQPFYWEIGDATQSQAAGSVAATGSATSYSATTLMSIASASKWLYAAYVVQRRNAALTATDIQFLHFQSGYTNFSGCLPGQTVDSCVAYQDNGVYSAATDGRFFYGGGHMEKHASLFGLGPLANAALASEIQSQLGTDVGIRYSQPLLAGGVVSTAADYAVFLRKLLGGSLQMGALLGTQAVCTNPTTCPAGTALATPIPTRESWHYSLGHWVEDDPTVGDGAFSSAGAFGFYPWIDAGKRWYGIVARQDVADSEGYASAQCGRKIRKAWLSGVAQ